MRAMWSRGTGLTGVGTPPPLAEDPALRPPQPACKPHHNSSSEASVSMDQTNSDDDPVSLYLSGNMKCHLSSNFGVDYKLIFHVVLN